MRLELRNDPLTLTLYGTAAAQDKNKSMSNQVMEAIRQTWAAVGEMGLTTTGINYVAYEQDQVLFAGVDLTSPQPEQSTLTKREYHAAQYAYYKHIGPYHQLPDVHHQIQSDLRSAEHPFVSPTIEVYGHWNEDETKLETEIYYPLLTALTCPICAQTNKCDLTASEGCWCTREIFPQAIFELVDDRKKGKACICKECLDQFKRNV
ncbi:cysteine-rich CWC family protein [Paenibacillus solisilvae]|uniref:Cysteine-rich CWC family protein n=1 Tax=Paenibacillus solisilvae TaxID=2486751 RepID=A0ABW0VXQ5_9BACL